MVVNKDGQDIRVSGHSNSPRQKIMIATTRGTVNSTELEFLNNLWGLEPSKNRVIVPARQATS